VAGKITFDFLPGFQFLKCIQRTSLVEHWVAMTPGGRMRAVKFIGGLKETTVFPPRHLLYIASLKNVKHPCLAGVDTVVNDTGRFVIVSDWTGHTLRDRMKQFRAAQESGIPREELIGYLANAAEGLEALSQRFGLHHLSLDPCSILLQNEHALAADYGLVELIWFPAGQPMASVNPRYAAPELFEDRFSETSDQYSLALIYMEMLLGELPQEAHSVSQWRALRTREPRVDGLPPDDRPIIARALERDPRRRFPNTRELFDALAAVAPRQRELQQWMPYEFRSTPLVTDTELPPSSGLVHPGAMQMVNRAVQAAAESLQVRELEGLRCLIQADGSFWHRCAAWLPKGMIYPKLEGLLNQWQAVVTQNTDDLLVFQLSESRNFFRRLITGGRRDIETQIRLLPPKVPGSQLTEVTIWIRYIGRDKEQGRKSISEVGPGLLQELRTYLLAMPEQRGMERFAFEHRLQVAPIFANAELGQAVECLGKDIARLGISFYAPGTPPTTLLFIHAVDPNIGELTIPARVLRIKPVGQNQCEVAARFLINDATVSPPLPPPQTIDLNDPHINVR
jgi:serine/threonine protein kinase